MGFASLYPSYDECSPESRMEWNKMPALNEFSLTEKRRESNINELFFGLTEALCIFDVYAVDRAS
jgi:hypothetical protein